MCLYIYNNMGEAPESVPIWSWIGDPCPLIPSWGMLFVLQSAAQERSFSVSPNVLQRCMQIHLTHRLLWVSEMWMLKTWNLPYGQEFPKGLLHNRNSPAGLVGQFFYCGQKDKEKAAPRKARPPLFSIHAELSLLAHILIMSATKTEESDITCWLSTACVDIRTNWYKSKAIN